MPTWTFTTSDPAEALKLSTFCLALPYTTERETPDTPAPAKAKPTRKAKPAKVEYWKDPEGVKVRKRTLAAIDTRTRSRAAPLSGQDSDPVRAYARALGVTPEAAAEKINAHNQHLADTPATYQW